MIEYVRVKQTDTGTGTEFSILRSQYEFAPDGFELLDKPAADTGGNPLPAKEKTTVAKAADRKTTGRQADPEKEND